MPVGCDASGDLGDDGSAGGRRRITLRRPLGCRGHGWSPRSSSVRVHATPTACNQNAFRLRASDEATHEFHVRRRGDLHRFEGGRSSELSRTLGDAASGAIPPRDASTSSARAVQRRCLICLVLRQPSRGGDPTARACFDADERRLRRDDFGHRLTRLAWDGVLAPRPGRARECFGVAPRARGDHGARGRARRAASRSEKRAGLRRKHVRRRRGLPRCARSVVVPPRARASRARCEGVCVDGVALGDARRTRAASARAPRRLAPARAAPRRRAAVIGARTQAHRHARRRPPPMPRNARHPRACGAQACARQLVVERRAGRSSPTPGSAIAAEAHCSMRAVSVAQCAPPCAAAPSGRAQRLQPSSAARTRPGGQQRVRAPRARSPRARIAVARARANTGTARQRLAFECRAVSVNDPGPSGRQRGATTLRGGCVQSAS